MSHEKADDIDERLAEIFARSEMRADDDHRSACLLFDARCLRRWWGRLRDEDREIVEHVELLYGKDWFAAIETSKLLLLAQLAIERLRSLADADWPTGSLMGPALDRALKDETARVIKAGREARR